MQNKRRSQNGGIAIQNGGVVWWMSKVTSIAFAHQDIQEAHADFSSGASEIYCAANAINGILGVSYVADEAGLDFPKPIPVQMDNTTAIAFCKNSVYRSQLKHIDCRQKWVQLLRDKSIMIPVYVNTKINLADILTKIMGPKDFIRLRDMIMRPYSKPK